MLSQVFPDLPVHQRVLLEEGIRQGEMPNHFKAGGGEAEAARAPFFGAFRIVLYSIPYSDEGGRREKRVHLWVFRNSLYLKSIKE